MWDIFQELIVHLKRLKNVRINTCAVYSCLRDTYNEFYMFCHVLSDYIYADDIYIHSQNDHLTFQDKSLDILSLIRLLSQCPVVFPRSC